MLDADPEVLAALGQPEAEVDHIVQDMAYIRRVVAERHTCQVTRKRLSLTDTVLVKVTHPSGRVSTVPLHQDAWPSRRPHVERHFGADNVTAVYGAALFSPAAA